jgi:hypothetical protein
MKKFVAICAAALLLAPLALRAETGTDELQLKLDQITKELSDVSKRLDATEKHTATDRILFTGDLRTKADTLHWQDATWNPAIKVDFSDFFAKVAGGEFGDPNDGNSPIGAMFGELQTSNPSLFNQLMASFGAWQANGMPAGMVGPFPLLNTPQKTDDIHNDIAYTTRLRLNMKAKVANNVDFAGRLAMYKNWGDSTGVKVFDSWNSFTMDGTDSGNTSGDWLRVERAYFDWKDIGGSNFYLSIGRRPSTMNCFGPLKPPMVRLQRDSVEGQKLNVENSFDF